MPHRKKGFTLAEVLVVAGLLSLLLAMAATVVLASMNTYARQARQDSGKQLGLAVYSFYEQRLQTADGVQLGGQADGSWHRLEVIDGHVLWDGEALYPASLYGGAKVRVAATAHPGAIGLTVEVYDDTRVIFTKRSAFPLVNLPDWGGQDTLPQPEPQGLIHYTDQEVRP